jgi:hypothetical protein
MSLRCDFSRVALNFCICTLSHAAIPILTPNSGCDISVSVVIGYRLDEQFSGLARGVTVFLSVTNARTETLYSGAKRLKCKVDPVYLYRHFAYVFMASCVVKGSDNFYVMLSIPTV